MDELLCEYVDGTMEPDVRAVFEECLQSDEELAREVHRLRNARSALSQYGGQLQASERAKRRLRNRLEDCLEEASAHQQTHSADRPPAQKSAFARLRAQPKLIGAVAAAFVVGLCTGSLLFGDVYHTTPPEATPVAVEERPPAPTQQSLMTLPASQLHPALAPSVDSSRTASALHPTAARQP